MVISDPVADALIRIKNGYLSSKTEVNVRYSKLILALCQLLVKNNYIESCQFKDREIVVKLKYIDRNPTLTDVRRVSKPGLRIYKGAKSLPRVLGGLGIAVISTPKGLMTEKEARKQNLGGEVLAEIW